MEKEKVSWNEFDKIINKIVKWAEPYNFGSIYGIPRGGLVPAVVLSYKLNIPLATEKMLKIKPYCGEQAVLIVDDICDSGKTLVSFSEYISATLYHRKNKIIKPTYYVADAEDKWIVFPWEEEKTSDKDNTLDKYLKEEI